MIIRVMCRLAFPSVWTATDYMGDGKFRYRATGLIAPNTPDFKTVEDAVNEVAKAKWGAKAPAVLASIKNDPNKFCWKNGDTKPTLNGFPGNWFLTATNEERPLVVDRNKSALLAADGKPYAGCYVNLSAEIWAQDNNYGKAIRASLRTVQFVRDGDSFGGGTPLSLDEVEDISEGADAGIA